MERALLQTQLVLRRSPAAIAAGLLRARSTITRAALLGLLLPSKVDRKMHSNASHVTPGSEIAQSTRFS